MRRDSLLRFFSAGYPMLLAQTTSVIESVILTNQRLWKCANLGKKA